jgi:hypothetical protein
MRLSEIHRVGVSTFAVTKITFYTVYTLVVSRFYEFLKNGFR